jgi:hypothetical protein
MFLYMNFIYGHCVYENEDIYLPYKKMYTIHTSMMYMFSLWHKWNDVSCLKLSPIKKISLLYINIMLRDRVEPLS